MHRIAFWLAAATWCASGQTKMPAQYRIQIRLQESGAQSSPKDSKYALLLQDGAKGSLNASYRIPYYSSSKGEARELHTVAIGNIFDCAAREANEGVRLECGFESSAVSKRPQAPTPVGFPPLIHSRQARFVTVLPFGKEVLAAAMDDPTSGNRVVFFVLAERVDVGER